MRRLRAASVIVPVATAVFSRTWSTRVVSEIAHVTAGCDITNLSKNCTQLLEPDSATQRQEDAVFRTDAIVLRADMDGLQAQQSTFLEPTATDVVRYHGRQRYRSMARSLPHNYSLYFSERFMPRTMGSPNSHRSNTPIRLHFRECSQVSFPVYKIMDLHQIRLVDTPAPLRLRHLCRSI